jgi:uracil-DNA glycosylase
MALQDLIQRVSSCRICRDHPVGRPLPHEPRPVFQFGAAARILIAGQAPGIRVHESGKPFTDPSGDRLRQWLGVDCAEFYDPRMFSILPMGFCFPGLDDKGADRPPRRECAPAWRHALLAEMTQIDLVICLGAHAMRWHMGEHFQGSVDAAVRNWQQAMALSPRAMPLPHPSWQNSGWLKRNSWFERDLLPVLQAEVKRLAGSQLAGPAKPV